MNQTDQPTTYTPNWEALQSRWVKSTDKRGVESWELENDRVMVSFNQDPSGNGAFGAIHIKGTLAFRAYSYDQLSQAERHLLAFIAWTEPGSPDADMFIDRFVAENGVKQPEKRRKIRTTKKR